MADTLSRVVHQSTVLAASVEQTVPYDPNNELALQVLRVQPVGPCKGAGASCERPHAYLTARY